MVLAGDFGQLARRSRGKEDPLKHPASEARPEQRGGQLGHAALPVHPRRVPAAPRSPPSGRVRAQGLFAAGRSARQGRRAAMAIARLGELRLRSAAQGTFDFREKSRAHVLREPQGWHVQWPALGEARGGGGRRSHPQSVVRGQQRRCRSPQVNGVRGSIVSALFQETQQQAASSPGVTSRRPCLRSKSSMSSSTFPTYTGPEMVPGHPLLRKENSFSATSFSR